MAGIFILMFALYDELIIAFGLGFGINIYKILLAIAAGAFITLLGCLPKNRKIAFTLQAAIATLYMLFSVSQYIYYKIFSTPYILASLSGAGDVLQFFQIIINQILKNWFAVALYFAQIILLFTVYRKYFLRTKTPTPRFAAAGNAVLMAAMIAVPVTIAMFTGNDVNSPKHLLLYDFLPNASLKTYGAVPTLALDFKYNILGLSTEYDDTPSLDNLQVDVFLSVPDGGGDPDTSDDPDASVTPVVYGNNVMDSIDWKLDETNSVYLEMNNYFSSQTPTSQNEYTGLFEGYNLVFIVAEGFSGAVIDPELTPTLYKMSTEGFVFNNFYTPIWSVSTSDGEFIATTGLLPKSGVWSYTEIADNYMPFAFGNQFSKLGYLSLAFHNHTYTYYNRHLSYPNMGYTYYAKGNGLDVTDQWPESDLEMIDLTAPMFAYEDNFNIYYLTVSGHLEYNFTGNNMSYIHRSEVEHLDYSSNVKAYIACQLELEYALESLIAQLDDAGSLENTVFVLSGDHYPYGLTNEECAELMGVDSIETTFQLYENTLLLWSASMEEPVIVNKYCSSLDIAPTVANLFGLEYDSRLYIGTDILSDSPALVMFNDRSFITDKIMYNAGAKRVTLLDASMTDEELQEHLTQYSSIVRNKFTYSGKIIEHDYYYYLFNTNLN